MATMAAVSIKRRNDLLWFHQHLFREISLWKFLRYDTIFSSREGKIPAWNGDNFVLGIWKYCKGYNSSEKLAISTGTLASFLLTFGA